MKRSQLSPHLERTLQQLANGATCGLHFGSLKALVLRGLAESYRGPFGTEYRITVAGKLAAHSMRGD